MRFTLQAGLVLGRGVRNLEVTRLLDNEEVVVEDQLTRRPTVMRVSELIKRLHRGDLRVVSGSIAISRGSQQDTKEDAKLLRAVDFAQLPEKAQAEMERRRRYLMALQAAHVSRGNRQRIEQLIRQVANAVHDPSPPSASSVMRWARDYAAADGNPLSLLSMHRLGKRRPPMLHPEVERTITRVLTGQYFTKAKHSVRHVMDCLQRELAQKVESGSLTAHEATVSRATVHRRIQQVDVYKRISSREGQARARMVCRTAMSLEQRQYPMQSVEIDHTPLNWVVMCDRTGLPLGRPTLTVAIDGYSNYVLGMYLTFYGPGVTSVVGVIRNSFIPKGDIVKSMGLAQPWLSHGVSDLYLLDNGLEFHSNAFKSICFTLGTDITYCRVRTPWLKPHVERFFGELNWLTLAQGRIEKRVANVMKIDPYKDRCITFSALVKGLTMFAVEVHPFEVNDRKLARPFDLFREGLERCPPASYCTNEQELRLVSGLTKELTVGPGGIELLKLPYGGAELLNMRKRHGERFKALCKWDPDDLGSIFVQDPEDRMQWVVSPCRWQDYASGLSWNQHRLIRSFARSDLVQKDAYGDLWKARMRLHDHWQSATRPRTRNDSLLAGRVSGLTSARVYTGSPEADSVATRPQLAARPSTDANVANPKPISESTPGAYIVPDFEAIDMEDA